jgi:viroplasmin and RNaseH domain-containing protein
VEFRSRNFPNNYEIEKRAETLAKIYLLQLYREEGRKAKQIYKNNEIEMNKQREIRKIKQEMDVEKVKEGEMIEEMDLIKQVYKILMLIEKKMNELAFAEFNSKNGEKATLIKRSLEKIKQIVHEEPSARNKLKILITYKHKKGW